jgi:hypothetical protein
VNRHCAGRPVVDDVTVVMVEREPFSKAHS